MSFIGSFSVLAMLAFASLASAQIDSDKFASDLRAKYGPPLSRETFNVRPGVEMVVNFAPNGHVCSIHLPPTARSTEPGQENVRTPKAIDDLVAELAPPALRGKLLGRFAQAVGRPSVMTDSYENVTISEDQLDNRRTGVTITFPNDRCTQY